MTNMTLQIQHLLSYSVVFPDKSDKLEDLVASVPSNRSIEFISYILAQKTNQLIDEHDFSIWAPWVMNTRGDVKNPIGQYANQHNIAQYSLIDKYALLLLISKLLTCYNGRNDELEKEDYSNLLLAYLICCDERLKYNKVLAYNSMTADEFVENYMPIALKSDDVEVPRDYRLLLIKCYMLLVEFPKVNTIFKEYLDGFCKDKGLPNPKSYLDELFLTFLNMRYQDISNCIMEVDEMSHVTRNYFDNMSIDPFKYKHDNDFLKLREKPILKTGAHRYNFMSMKLFLDKAYTGLIFDIKDNLVTRGVINAKEGYANLRSLLGNEFSERMFFYTIMHRCFGLRYVHFSGEELEAQLGAGMPDYYMRRGNRVFIFECKDAQVASSKKLSGNYKIIQEAIYDKYVENAHGRPKGVGQIVKVIERKLPKIMQDVDCSAPLGITYIFPIIIYFDNFFDIEGPSYLLNKKFKETMSNCVVQNKYAVKDVVMINIEQLMRLEDFFANDKLKLATVINSYIDYKTKSELNQVFPFNKFLFQEAQKKGYKLKKTKWFDEIYDKLVAMDNKAQNSLSAINSKK